MPTARSKFHRDRAEQTLASLLLNQLAQMSPEIDIEYLINIFNVYDCKNCLYSKSLIIDKFIRHI